MSEGTNTAADMFYIHPSHPIMETCGAPVMAPAKMV